MPQLDIEAASASAMDALAVGFSSDRTKTIGSSEIGACARMVGYRKSSTPVDVGYVDSNGFAARGNLMETGYIVPLLTTAVEACGGELLWAGQANQMGLINEKKGVSATPDGLAVRMPKDALARYGVKDILNGGSANSGSVLVEMKSIDSRVNVSNLPKDTHVDQVNLAMGLVRDTTFEDDMVHTPNYALIVYVDASNYALSHVFVVKFDEEGYKGQLERAKNIMDAAKKGLSAVETLRPEAKIAGGKDCKYCAFSKRCLGYTALVPKATQVPDKKVVLKIRKLARALRLAQEKAGTFDKQAALHEAELKEVLITAQTKWLDLGDLKLNWTTSEGRATWNYDAMKKRLTDFGVNLDEYRGRSKPSESLRVDYVKQLAGA